MVSGGDIHGDSLAVMSGAVLCLGTGVEYLAGAE
jgi:hypothetical protein